MTKSLKRYCSRIFILPIFLIHLFAQSQQSKYFQQKVDYTIHVKLDDVNHQLIAKEKIDYINNSPNELDTLYFHLWPNAYKNNSTALGEQFRKNGPKWKYFADTAHRGYITGLDFSIDGEKIEWEYSKDHIDICKLILKSPLKPKDTITIYTPFQVKLPRNNISRLGHWRQTYDISQWYPKPAVYDKDGWHAMPYLDMGEFYSEFGTFDVFITLPDNYTVGATGDLVDNPKEMKRLDSIAHHTKLDLMGNKIDTLVPKSSKKLKTLHYHQENVHDFAWFANKKFLVLKGELELPYSKRKLTLWSMFTPYTVMLWKNSIEYLHDAAYYYSLWVGEYPYKQITAIESPYGGDGGGMEYPNITVIGKAYDSLSLENVIVHEVGHNWFYGIVASNERDYPWMDEGMNTFYENRYMQTKYPYLSLSDAYIPNGKKLTNFDKFKYKEYCYQAYNILAADNSDQPMSLNSEGFDDLNYAMIVYCKSSAVFNYFMHVLGEDSFDLLMQEYYNKWKFKHPQPVDFKSVVQNRYGGKYDWFVNEIISTNKKIDYKISRISKKSDRKFELKLRNRGSIASPFSISAIEEKKPDTTIWFHGFKKSKKVTVCLDDCDELKIDFKHDIPEINRQNNAIKTKGLLRKIEPIKFQLAWAMDDPEFSQIYGCPIAGWNYHDGLMTGAALYSTPLPKKQFNYLIMPLFSTKRKKLAGNLNLGYTFFPNFISLQKVKIGINSKTYGYETTGGFNGKVYHNKYTKFAPELSVELFPISRSPKISHRFRFRNVHINKEYLRFNSDSKGEAYAVDNASYYMNVLDYELENSRAIQPFTIFSRFEQNNQIVKASLCFNYRFDYRKYNRALKFRFFGGGFLFKQSLENISQDYRFRLSSWNGLNDYLFDYFFAGRNAWDKAEYSQQMVLQDGGFKIPAGVGQTWDWLSAANLDIDFPGKIPIGVYGDIGVFVNNETSIYNAPAYMYEMGGRCTLLNGICNIYFPAWISDDIEENIELTTANYMERIRFSLYLNKLNPLKQIENAVK